MKAILVGLGGRAHHWQSSCEEHPEVEEDVANRCAGLVEGVAVGQKVLRPESLDSMDRSEPAGDMHAGVHDIAPDMVKGLGVGGIGNTLENGHLSHGFTGTHYVEDLPPPLERKLVHLHPARRAETGRVPHRRDR